MKKNLFKKGVSVLGTILLLANVILPGIVAYAEEIPETPAVDETPTTPETPVVDETPTTPAPKMLGFSKKNLTLLSQVAVNEASIGDQQYSTLKEAFEGAKDGDTITLLKNVTVDETGVISVNKKVTFDMNEKSLTYVPTESVTKLTYVALISIINDGELTITGNGTINGPANGSSYDGRVIISVEGGTLNYLNGTLNAYGNGSDGMYGVYILQGGTAIFGTEGETTGPTISSYFAAIGTNNTTAPATIKVYGGSYEEKATPSGARWHYFCAPIYAAAAGSYDIQGGTFKGEYGISSRYANVTQTISIGTNVTFNTTSSTELFIDTQEGSEGIAAREINTNKDGITLPNGYEWAEVSGNKIAIQASTIALNGTTEFSDLSDAFSEANDDDTITLLKDVTINEEGVITVNKDITFDMNGKTITYTPSESVTKASYTEFIKIESDGILTITGEGTINGPANGSSYDGRVMISVEGGTLNYLNGTLNAYGNGSDGMYGVYVLENGTAIFGTEGEGGPTITAHFAAIGTNNTTAPASIIVYGGTYKEKATPSSTDWWHYFCAPIYAAAAGSYDIQGGTFEGKYGISSRYVHANQTITVGTNVTFNTTSTQLFIDKQTGTTAGTNREVSSTSNTRSIPEGYEWVEEDGVYKIGHKVTFDSNEGSAVEEQHIIEGQKIIKPENPTKTDKAFDGWYKESELTNLWNFDTDVLKENKTLYAKWSEPVTVSFNTNGGTTITSQIIPINSNATKPSNPTKAGYNFAGWYSDSALTKSYDFNTAVNANITLYAKWTAIPASSGGSGGTPSSSSTTNKQETKAKTGDVNTGATEEINLGGEVTDEANANDGKTPDTSKPAVIISDRAKNNYKPEQIEAYIWAYENGITTINDIEKARLSDSLTRAELAKMMSQYISSVLKKSPIKADLPGYRDVNESLGDLADYIVKAYQYQIMGIDADGNALEYFYPNNKVTRAEYGTVFSRVLYGSVNNQKDGPYYEKHLAALKEAGILTNDDPTMEEVRGWVMIMMYRSVNPQTPAEETDNQEPADINTGSVAEVTTGATVEAVTGNVAEATTGAIVEAETATTGTVAEATTGAVAADAANNTTGAVAEATTGSTAEVATGTVNE